jgi:serine/threonine-protein kinase
MEFVEGLTLRRYLRHLGRSLILPEVLYVVRPICGALHYAHQMGVYHCDVKPPNVFIERRGRVVLADFGVARLTESATVTFSTPGTPAYMSPEQCRGEELDACTDIYSLGITTYEMLTLDRPFKGNTEETTGSRRERVRWEHMHLPPPPPRSVNPRVPPIAEAAILRALEKEPRRRQQGALDFYQELSSAGAVQPANSLPRIAELVSPAPSEPPPSPPPSLSSDQEERAGADRTLPAVGTGVAVVGVVGVVLIVGLLALIFNLQAAQTSATPTPTVATAVVTATPRSTSTSLPTLTPSPTPIPSPAPTNTSIVADSRPSSCPGAPPQRVRVGERARVCTAYEQLIVRAQPRRSSSELTRLKPGTYVTVVDGPICANAFSWWKVRTNSGTVGWVAEGGDEIDPYFICPAR